MKECESQSCDSGPVTITLIKISGLKIWPQKQCHHGIQSCAAALYGVYELVGINRGRGKTNTARQASSIFHTLLLGLGGSPPPLSASGGACRWCQRGRPVASCNQRSTPSSLASGSGHRPAAVVGGCSVQREWGRGRWG